MRGLNNVNSPPSVGSGLKKQKTGKRDQIMGEDLGSKNKLDNSSFL